METPAMADQRPMHSSRDPALSWWLRRVVNRSLKLRPVPRGQIVTIVSVSICLLGILPAYSCVLLGLVFIFFVRVIASALGVLYRAMSSAAACAYFDKQVPCWMIVVCLSFTIVVSLQRVAVAGYPLYSLGKKSQVAQKPCGTAWFGSPCLASVFIQPAFAPSVAVQVDRSP